MWIHKTGRAGMAAAFAVAMAFAVTCTVTCGLGACIKQVDLGGSASHHDHDSSGHSSTPSDHGSHDPDCATHGHPDVFLKAPATPLVALSVAPGVNIAGVSAPVTLPEGSPATTVFGRDHAPPQGSKEPLYQRISLLRI